MKKDNLRTHLRIGLISALGFGVGMPLSITFINLIKRTRIVGLIGNLFTSQYLFTALILVFFFIALGGALAGAAGGLALSYADGTYRKRRYALYGALGFGIGFALILYPLTFLLSTFAFYSPESPSPLGIILTFAFVGAVFGLVSGNILGIATYGRNRLRFGAYSAFSFGLAGTIIGFRVWYYFYILDISSENPVLWLLWFTLFGIVGGLFLGLLYSFGIERGYDESRDKSLDTAFLTHKLNQFKNSRFYLKRGFWGTLLFFALIYLLIRFFSMSPLGSAKANLSTTLDSQTLGTHWSQPQTFLVTAEQPAIFATDFGTVAAAWVQDGEIYLSTAQENDEGIAKKWTIPQNLSKTDATSSSPQIVIDSEGDIHLIWIEEASGTNAILYLRCSDGQCASPITLSAPADPSCDLPPKQWQNQDPALAISNSDEIMLIWGTGTASLPYSSWHVSDASPNPLSGCVSGDAILGQARLSANPQGGFSLVFTDIPSQEIYLSEYKEKNWDTPLKIGSGENPEIVVATDGEQVAWCDEYKGLNYWQEEQGTRKIDFAGCVGRPSFAQGETLRLLWYSDRIENIDGVSRENQILFESEKNGAEQNWSSPTIVAQPNIAYQPALAVGKDNHLHLLYRGDEALNYVAYVSYSCEGVELSRISQAVLDVAESGEFHPPDYEVPYCKNQYDRLIYAPNPVPEFSQQIPAPDGSFAKVADLIKGAKYEVVYSTMWYDSDIDADNPDNPGTVVAQAIKELYDQLEANPSQYPRGISVKILLDNPPEFTASRFISQVWNVFNDLRDAGVPMMSNPEIGWDLQVANYEGSWPHGHTKLVVVDGRTSIAAGFNFQYSHFPENHRSGHGKGRMDLALQTTGPVAQATLRAFDDLWTGATLINCPDLDSDSPLWWISCKKSVATVAHVPEVLKYYLPEATANAFALHRTEVYKESDQSIIHTLESAEKSIDIIQVNFSFGILCNLNALFKVCDFSAAPAYIEALMTALEEEHVQIRILLEDDGIEGFENTIAVNIFLDELKARGLSDLVEIRYFTGLVHAKSMLIDEEFLIIGSQNFHYSAFGEGGLTEFNLATDDAQATEDYKALFEYYWENGTLLSQK